MTRLCSMAVNPYESPHSKGRTDEERNEVRSQKLKRVYNLSLTSVAAAVGLSLILFSVPMPGLEVAFMISLFAGLFASISGIVFGLTIARHSGKYPPSLLFHAFVLLLFCGMLAYCAFLWLG